eukprot:3249900-Prymnesium_polylepis.1
MGCGASKKTVEIQKDGAEAPAGAPPDGNDAAKAAADRKHELNKSKSVLTKTSGKLVDGAASVVNSGAVLVKDGVNKSVKALDDVVGVGTSAVEGVGTAVGGGAAALKRSATTGAK